MNEKFNHQDNQYLFPYHYIPSFGPKNTPLLHRVLDWGFEYLTYISFIQEKIKELSPRSILDVGCGDGYLLNHLDINGCDKQGIDLSEKAIRFANAFSSNTKFEVKDIFDLKEQYEMISLIEVLEHIPDEILENFVKKINDLTSQNGYFIVSVPTTNEPVHRKHFRHYDDTLLTQHIDNNTDFKIIEEYYIYSNSKILKKIRKLFHNKFYTLNAGPVKRLFWKFHKKYFYYSNKTQGSHLIRIYKKVSNDR